MGDAAYTYERIKGGYTASFRMVGAMMSLVSVVLAGTLAALTLFLVQSDMDEDVRNMGLCQALGMTEGRIMGIYLICYGAIGLAGAAFGGLFGGWLSGSLLTQALGDLGLYGASLGGTGRWQLLAGGLVLAAVLLISFCALFRVRRLNASYAVRTGRWRSQRREHRKHRGYSPGRVPFGLYYAVRGMGDKKLRYGFIAGMSLVLGRLSTVCLGCLHAVGNIDQDPELWGFICTDMYITSLGDVPVSGILPELEWDPRVEYTYGVNKTAVLYQPESGGAWRSMVTEVYELPWKEEIKDRALYGRQPQEENEISVGLTLAREYELEVGDTLELVVNGKRDEYQITGIFQTLSNYGNVIWMVTGDLDGFAKAGGAYGDYMLVLRKGTDKWAYVQELAERYGGAFSFIASKSNGENIAGILRPAMSTVLGFLFLVTLLAAVNLTVLLIRREQRLIGLLKAIGMPPRQILGIYAWRNGLSALAGNTLGLLLGVFVVPELLSPYARLLGLTEFPFANSATGLAVSLVFLPVCMLLGTSVIVKTIGRVSVKRLVDE